MYHINIPVDGGAITFTGPNAAGVQATALRAAELLGIEPF